MKITKVKVWDNQLQKYCFDNAIFENEEEAIEQLLSFFSVDNSKKELKLIEEDLIRDKEAFGLRLVDVEV